MPNINIRSPLVNQASDGALPNSSIAGALLPAGLGIRFTIDIAKELSLIYGKLIRQNQIFKIGSIHCRLVNPNTAVQDEFMGAAGHILYFHPTKWRIAAIKSAFNAVQAHRKNQGIKTAGYDFRVGFNPYFGTVTQQANIIGDAAPLYLSCPNNDSITNVINLITAAEGDASLLATILAAGGFPDQGIFNVWNEYMPGQQLPRPSGNGFGSPYQSLLTTAGITDPDFVSDEDVFFTRKEANTKEQAVPFQLAYTHVTGSQLGVDGEENTTTGINTIKGEKPLSVLNGLLGVTIDTTGVNDHTLSALLGSQDTMVEFSIEVLGSKSYMKKKRKRRSRRRMKSRRRRRSRK